jgi:Glycosyl transferase family 2/Pentapeptide repeats (8 copies)
VRKKRGADIGCMTAILTCPAAPAGPTAYRVPALDVVVPVAGEQHDLEPCVRRLHAYLTGIFPLPFRITIAGHATAIPAGAEMLEAALPEVRVAHLPEKERGQALRTAWLQSDALVLAYMEADPAADLTALLPLVAPLLSGHSDLAIGTRLARTAQTARVVRGPSGEFAARGYHVLLRWILRARFSDAQCGFKAIRREVAQPLLPLVEDTGRFFDTELLVLAERAGLRIAEVPVDWAGDPGRRADLRGADLRGADLRGAIRLSRALAARRRPVAALRAQLGRAPLTPSPLASRPGLAGA